jgi:hypothetical protein
MGFWTWINTDAGLRPVANPYFKQISNPGLIKISPIKSGLKPDLRLTSGFVLNIT